MLPDDLKFECGLDRLSWHRDELGHESLQVTIYGIPELSIIRHGVATSFIFSQEDGTPVGDVHLTELSDDRYDLTGGFVGSDFNAFVQQLDKGMALVEFVIEQSREDNHD